MNLRNFNLLQITCAHVNHKFFRRNEVQLTLPNMILFVLTPSFKIDIRACSSESFAELLSQELFQL